MNEKIALREKFRRLREQLSREEVLEKSERIERLLFKLPEFKEAETVAFYVAKRESKEVETERMIKRALKIGKKVLVPLVNAQELRFSELRDFDSELALGTFGILEPKPASRRLVRASESNIILVPGLAFDLCGYRLGYGMGYYDRLLRGLASAKPSLPFAGLAYEMQLVDKLPNTEYDMPLDILVAERRVLRFKPKKTRV